MPTYCFKRRDNQQIVEITMTMAEMERRGSPIKLKGGVLADRDYAAQFSGSSTPGNWPMYSEAAAVMPDQVKEAAEQAKSLGVPTEFRKDGCPKFESNEHRRKFLKAHGMYDRNAFC